MNGIKLGRTSDGTAVVVDHLRLVDSRMLVQGSSGCGKSWLLRLIAEQAGASIQTVVLDPEGEFATLREKLDCVLVGRGGELPTDVRSAGLLSRKLLELNLSAVIDLYDLQLHDRRRFVRLFLESLLHLPKTLWHPTLIVLDEAHKYAAEGEKTESTQAVIDLMSQGRKRGYGGILATQRLSKLHKDASAECQNVFIGRTWQDVDRKRAADILGIDKAESVTLRDFADGEFYAFGPAISVSGVTKFRTDPVRTTHPKAGERHRVEPPAPSAAIRRALGELTDLTDLPEQAQAEIRDLSAAKAEIARLQTELRRQQIGPTSTAPALERETQRALREKEREWQTRVQDLERSRNGLVKRLRHADKLASQLQSVVHLNGEAEPPAALVVRPVSPVATEPRQQREVIPDDELRLGGGALRMVQVLADAYPAKFTEAQWATLSGLKRTGGTWATYKSTINRAGLVERSGNLWFATPAAAATYGDASRHPQTTEEIIGFWKSKLGSGPARMIDSLFAVYPDFVTRAELGERIDVASTGGSFGTYLSRLRANGIVETDGQTIRLSAAIMEAPAL